MTYGNVISSNGDVDVVKLLLDRDANIRAKNNHGDTALMQAAVSGKTEVVKLLQDKGAH